MEGEKASQEGNMNEQKDSGIPARIRGKSILNRKQLQRSQDGMNLLGLETAERHWLEPGEGGEVKVGDESDRVVT